LINDNDYRLFLLQLSLKYINIAVIYISAILCLGGKRMAEVETREKFLEAGKKEFLEKGFKEASLRQICKNLGLTLGAFYGYFKSKEDLFDTIVSKPANDMLEYYVSYHKDYMEQEAKLQKDNMKDVSNDALSNMINFMYEYYKEFKLVFCCAIGTKYEFYLEEYIKVEVESTKQFLENMKNNHYFEVDIDEQLCHILVSMLFEGIVEIFEHDMDYEYAIKYVDKLRIFYTAGWMKLFEE
jgi:TetR/AcrR family transcriptional regulator